ncbi:hypothetical protein FLA105534_04046 [Flavobacterium bizetiae]|uniref:Uncharacterized protein n=2 Tax=Flavobacterium bizetiae TaxID=2704140 RepID=A0A6J4GXX2_9FLAO|nr:hypothetical protein FLA105534_04046 [Flavobacterium bizetiae]CAD5344791.1 hypothetical protein FLA105535_04800 [Flavobacterium bizetiae]CAD5350702.1 hypothetical protein FLA105534_04696 [Flavobacterium bizetiae]
MEENIYFLRFKFTFLQFIALFFGWNFFICFIWPLMIESYFGVTIFVCAFSLVFAMALNNKLILWLFLLFHINKKIVIIYQKTMLYLSAYFGTCVFSWFMPPMSIYVFLEHLFINTLTVFLYFTFVMKATNREDI